MDEPIVYSLTLCLRLCCGSEIMFCNFSSGLEPVSILELVPTRFPAVWRPPGLQELQKRADDREGVDMHHHYGSQSDLFSDGVVRPPWPKIPDPPVGWRGSQVTLEEALFELIHTGSWHDRAPGETRVHVDYTGFVSFYDASLTSLVELRTGQDRFHHRLQNITREDTDKVMDELDEVLSRGWNGVQGQRKSSGSRVDWGSITTIVTERYGERLESLEYILEEGRFQNVTRQVSLFRAQLLVMLSPYMLISALPPPEVDPTSDPSWITPIIRHCSITYTSRIDTSSLTRQERRIKSSVEDVLAEICGTLGGLWVAAFDIEAAELARQEKVLQDSRAEIARLMKWLGWPMWVKCKPGCGPEV